MTRTCTKCGETKAEEQFVSRGGEYRNLCKECKSRYNKDHYAANKPYYRDKAVRNHAIFLAWYLDLKRGPCLDCGNAYHPVAMDWDHRPGEDKTSEVGTLRAFENRQKILDEIVKCDLVCAVCHRLRTAKRCGVI